MFPEKISEDIKENSNTYAAAALGRCLAWDAYFLNEETGKWNRRVLLDYNNITPEGLQKQFSVDKARPEFLFEKDNVADDWRNIIHWFIGNCSTVAPYRYYSIRSIGYQLYGPAFAQNMTRNRVADHVQQSLLTWFRNVSEDDRERLEDIQLHHLGIFPDGVSMVTAQERYTADWNLVGNFLGNNRSLMAESSAAFLPDSVAFEGEKPAMTATESLIRNNASVTLTSSVQAQLYKQAKHLFKEIVRRICLKDERDPIVKDVLRRMDREGIPREILDIEILDVTPNRVMGGGNRAVELTTAQALFQVKGAMGPTADLPIRRKYMLALTNDPEFVRATLPEEPVVSRSAVAAQYAFGTLMEGVPVQQGGALNEMEYVDTLIKMMALGMQPLEALQQQPNAIPIAAERIAGLVNVGQHIEEHIQLVAQDPNAREFVRNAERAVQQLMGELKAYGQRITEMEQAQAEQSQAGGLSPEAQAKIISAQTVAQAKAQIMQQTHQIKLQHKDAAFVNEQQRKDAQTVAEIRRKEVLTHADVASKDLTTQADLIHQARQAQLDTAVSSVQAEQDVAHTARKHAVDIEAQKAKKAAASKAKPTTTKPNA